MKSRGKPDSKRNLLTKLVNFHYLVDQKVKVRLKFLQSKNSYLFAEGEHAELLLPGGDGGIEPPSGKSKSVNLQAPLDKILSNGAAPYQT